MNNKHEALEAMLANYFENGTDIETALAEYPEFADELRPLLQAAMDASSLAVSSIPDDVARRGRTRLLQQAAQMRDAASSSQRAPLFNFRVAALALTFLVVFFLSGTGLVSASDTALPGDGLYVVKRGWENARVLFADNEEALNLEAEFEAERRTEVAELLVYSRVALVEFEGEVTHQNGSKWQVAGVPVLISEETIIENEINVGDEVIINGRTESDAVVLASEIILTSSGMPAPPPAPEKEVAPSKTAVSTKEPRATATPELDDDEETPIPTEEPDDGGDDDGGDGPDDDDGGDDDDDGDDPTPEPDDDDDDGDDDNDLTPTPLPDDDDTEDDEADDDD